MEYTPLEAELRLALAGTLQSVSFGISGLQRSRGLDLRDLARQLTEIADTEPSAGLSSSCRIDAKLVRSLLAARQMRNQILPAQLFADPVWDLLLDLTAARLENKLVSVSSACLAANVPTTTALRVIKALCASGTMVRERDPLDSRRTYLTLSAPMYQSVLACLAKMSEIFMTQICMA